MSGSGGREDERYRYRSLDATEEADDVLVEAAAEDDEVEDDEEAPPSEFWPAAAVLKGATIADAELELSHEASVYADAPAAELRLWLEWPDGVKRMVQIDEPHNVWIYRQAHPASGRPYEEYPDHRFELPGSDLRVLRSRRRRQLIDQQQALYAEMDAVREELEELEHDIEEAQHGTDGWPGTRWP